MIEHILKPKRKTSTGQSTDDGAPNTYDAFLLPSGVDLDDELDGKFRILAKQMGLSQDDAQKLVDLYVQHLDTLNNRAVQEHVGRITAWQKQSRADREIGGANFSRNMQTAQKAVERFGGDRLADALTETGAASHPEVLRCFYRMGRALSEDGYVAPNGKRQTKSYAETFYPKHNY